MKSCGLPSSNMIEYEVLPRRIINVSQGIVNLQKKSSVESYFCISTSWGRLNKKDGLTRYGDSHVKDKTS